MLCVAEGASDTAALHTLGLPAVGLASKGQCGDLLTLLVQRLKVDRILLLPDADDRGERGMAKIGKRLAEYGIESRLAHPPSDAKDVREYLTKGGNAAGILELLDGVAEKVVRR